MNGLSIDEWKHWYKTVQGSKEKSCVSNANRSRIEGGRGEEVVDGLKRVERKVCGKVWVKSIMTRASNLKKKQTQEEEGSWIQTNLSGEGCVYRVLCFVCVIC